MLDIFKIQYGYKHQVESKFYQLQFKMPDPLDPISLTSLGEDFNSKAEKTIILKLQTISLTRTFTNFAK